MFVSATPGVVRGVLLAGTLLLVTIQIPCQTLAADESIKNIALVVNKENNHQGSAYSSKTKLKEAISLYRAGNRDFESKNYHEAIATYRKAVDLQPAFPPVHYNLGMVHLAIGQKKQAAHHLKTFLDLRPNAFNASEIKDLIQLLND